VGGNTIWAGMGFPCATTNDGDPIVLYDHLAGRWFISQFALPNDLSGPFYQCIAVSQTGNPTGSWHRYSYLYSNTKMNDYPKFGVWPDGYYMTVNQFTNNGNQWGGAGVAVFERDKMLQGLTARMLSFDLYSANPNFGGMLPSDLDGPPPPAGTPNYFMEADDSSWIGPVDAVRIWEFHVNWSNTDASTFGINLQPNSVLPIAPFTPLLTKVPQLGTPVQLDALAERLMHRLQYRNFGDHASLVANHTVNAGSNRAAVRWYELRNSGGGWNIQQQGTYAGDSANSLHRWMASAAMDRTGNIAIGYSRSSSSLYPDIAYTGRLVDDPPNTLPQGETILYSGNGAQTHSYGRWGDYSMMSVDPTDDCTFWYTNQYYPSSSLTGWRTRIGSFTFPSCLSGQHGTLQGTVTSGGSPLAGALVEAGGFNTHTGPDGIYIFSELPVGTYTLTASAYGYQTVSLPNVSVAYDTTTVQNFSLASLPLVDVHGAVTDGSGQGWPLYARIDITAPGFSQGIYTDPLTGAYQIHLPAGTTHTFTADAVSDGYTPATVQVTPAMPGTTQNISLSIDPGACTAPGYLLAGSCNPLAGGLLVGYVTDLNNDAPINGAAVTSNAQPGDSTLTFATPGDPAQPDGLYILFSSLIGSRSFTATSPGYGGVSHSATISDGGISSRSFALPAGWLQVNPQALTANLAPGQVTTALVTLSNSGGLAASFTISEVDASAQELSPSGPFARATRHTSPKRLGDLDARAVYDYVPPPADALPGGQVLRSWLSGLAHPWGIGYDPRLDRLWIGDVAAAGGDDRLHPFDLAGTSLGEGIDTSASAAIYAAGIAFDPFTGLLWQVPVGGDSCLFAIDPVEQAMTGARICPAFDHSQRGLAFNPLNQSFYSGSWTNGILYHFDQSGTILDSANLDLNISALAFNPATRHLFVLSNASLGFDVYVLDTQAGYAILGGFDIPGLGDFEQAGLSLDCAGHLWVTNQASGMVLEVDSGETAPCAYAEIPWLSVTPLDGLLAPGGNQVLQVRLDANAAPAPSNHATLVISGNTPYQAISLPVNLITGYIFHFPLIYQQWGP